MNVQISVQTLAQFDLAPTASALSRIAAPAIRSLVVAGAVGVTLAALRVSGARVKLTVWRSVLCVALAMPLLSLVVPPVAVPMSFLDGTPILGDAIRPIAVALSGVSAQPIATASSPVLSSASSKSVFAANLKGGAPKLSALDSTGAALTLTGAMGDPHATSPASLRSGNAKTGSSSASVSFAKRESLLQRWRERIRAQITFTRTMALVYLAGFVVLAARMITGIALGGRLARRAKTIHHHRAVEHLQDCARAMDMQPAPRLAESAALRVPVTFGVVKPAVLLPVEWTEWSDAQLDSVLMHELSHVARRDALTERLSMLHRALFWFSPLSWWLDRELARLAEQASDEAALASGIAREQYAETLLGFFTALQATPGRVRWQGVSMAASGQAEKRVERILRWKGETQMTVRKPIIAAIVCAAVPVVCLASAFTPSFTQYFLYQDAAPAAPATKPSPAPAARPSVAPVPNATPRASYSVDVAQAPAASQSPAPAALASPVPEPPPAPAVSVSVPVTASVAVAPMAIRIDGPGVQVRDAIALKAPVAVLVAPTAVPHVALAAPVAVHVNAYQQQGASIQADGSNAIRIRDLDGLDEYVIVSGKFSYSVITEGDNNIRITSDSGDASSLRAKYGDNFIWFKRGGKEYVIRDQAQIAKVKALFDREAQLGKQQGELGEQQGKLGEEQGQLGSMMGQYNVNVPDMTAELAKIQEQMKNLQNDPSWKIDGEKMKKEMDEALAKMNVDSPEFKEQMEQLHQQMKQFQNSDMQEQMQNLQAEMSELNGKMAEGYAESGERSAKLGELQAKLGQKQSVLGEKQGELGRQQGEISRQIDEMMKSLFDQAVASGKAEVK